MIPSDMRRFLIIVAFLALGFGAFGAWWVFFWVNPQEVLSQSLQNLAKAKTVQSFRASVSWDLQPQAGEGFVFQKWLSCAVSLDATDPTKPKADGVIGYTIDPSGQDFHTADAVLASDRAFIRLREDAGRDLKDWFDSARREAASVSTSTSATSTEPAWFSFDRSALLAKAGVGSWTAAGKGADVRAALLGAGAGSWAAAGPAKTSIVNGRRTMEITLRPNANAINAGLVALIQAWRKRGPTGAEFDWASRAAAAASRGTWTATIDVPTRTLTDVRGRIPILSDSGEIVGRISVEFAFDGFNAPVSVKPPSTSIDLTSAIIEKAPTTFTPSKVRPVVPPPTSATGTSSQ
jgi:hypothetical protein